MPVKIASLEAENVKRIKAVQIEPAATGLTVIGGNNGQGKTSVLDAIAWALGGEKYRPAAAQREGANTPPRLQITLSNGLVVERRGKNSSLTVTDPEGRRAGQQLLNEFVEQLALDLPRFMAASDKDNYAIYLADMISQSVKASEGSALVLFTSREMMEMVYALVKDTIELPLLIQKGGTSTNLLRKKFLSEKNSILFGLRSFWEGIDVPGDSLRLLIITQLPFPHIQDCIMRARSRQLEKEEKSPFLFISVPEMLITLKQGLGRLIRSESDRGVVIIADGRTSRYIEAIRNCLPPYYIPDEDSLDTASFAQKIENFLF